MRDDLKAELVVDALAMAVTRRRPPAGVTFITRTGDRNTARCSSARRSGSRGSCRASAASATPATTPPASP
jgi:hypothetical protein